MKKLLQIVFAICLLANFAQGQTLNVSFRVVTNNGSNLTIAIDAYASGSTNMGGGNLVFDFNGSNLSYPASPATPADYSYNSSITGNSQFATTNVTRPVSNEVSLNLNFGYTGTGLALSTNSGSPTEIAQITLTTLTPSGAAGLTWNSGASGLTDDGANFYTLNLSNSGSPSPLPVTLSHFDVTAQGQTDAKLTWQTATETNNRGFYVERSIDGNRWEVVNFVSTLTPGGNSKILTNYQYLDANVYKSWNGISTYYYRLRQQDMNGTEEYVGGVKAVRFGGDQAAAVVSVFPNPASQFINITVKNGVAARYTITDITGRPVANGSYAPRISVANLKSGNYQVRVFDVTGAVLGTQQVIIAR